MKHRCLSLALVLLLPACNYVEQAKEAVTASAPAAPAAAPAPEPEPTPEPAPEPTPEPAAQPAETPPAELKTPDLTPEALTLWKAAYVEMGNIGTWVEDYAFERLKLEPKEAKRRFLEWEKSVKEMQRRVPAMAEPGNAVLEMMACVQPGVRSNASERLKKFQAAREQFFNKDLPTAMPPEQ